MSTAFTLVNQTVIMFILAGIGYIMFRCGKVTLEGSKTIGNLLIYLVLPCVIINGFLVERTREHLIGLGLSAVLAFVILMISVLVSNFFFKKDPIAAFGGAFSNPGFFGVPLIIASLSDGAVFYIAAFIGFLNLLQWSYGVSIMTGEKGRISAKSLVTAPFFIAIVIGFILFLTQCPLPSLVTKTLLYLTGLNTPLSMFTVGVYLAQTDLLAMFQRKSVYLVCLVRLIIIPLIALAILYFVPETYLEMKLAILIASGCPVGSNIAVYAQLHDRDYPYAVQTVVVSTLFSIITIPVIVGIGTMLMG